MNRGGGARESGASAKSESGRRLANGEVPGVHPSLMRQNLTGRLGADAESCEKRPIGRHRIAAWSVFALIFALVLYFELKSQPSFTAVFFIPRPLAAFCDHHDFLNNVVAYGALTASTHFAFGGPNKLSISHVAARVAYIAVAILALEFAQRYLPYRNCDWHDVLAGWLGAATASLPWLGRASASVRANT